MDIIQTLQQEFSIRKEQVEQTVRLLDEGNTVPFIARYRKEMTGALDDQVIRHLAERLAALRNLEEKREQVMRSITEQGAMTEELEAKLLAAQRRQNWTICTARIAPNVVPVLLSRAKKDLHHLPNIFGDKPIWCLWKNTRKRLYQRNWALKLSKTPYKAQKIFWQNRFPMMLLCVRYCAKKFCAVVC